jgi:hypothetical protein
MCTALPTITRRSYSGTTHTHTTHTLRRLLLLTLQYRRRGYLEGTPKWYLGVAKFGNHVLSSLLEEVSLR